MKGKLRKSVALTIAAFLIAFPKPGQASEAVMHANGDTTGKNVLSYWTAERLRSAKTLVPEATSSSANTSTNVQSTSTESSVSANGQPPTVNVSPNLNNLLFEPIKQLNAANNAFQPNNVGTEGAYFTSSRLIPLTADLSYPYRTVGKLFFTKQDGSNWVCSASVLRPRIVLTAGHCVHNGNGDVSGYYSNFLFIPGFRDGNAPYGKWSYTVVQTTSTWFSGNDDVPNAADYAILEMADNDIDGTSRRIGDVVGYLGYQTLNLFPNHATLLGYPCNLDSCAKMHQVTAGSFKTGDANTVIYGSDMAGGSSGGPWIKNFGVAADGQNFGKDTAPNRIIGVTSYGDTDPNVLSEGSSILDSRFINLLNERCNAKSGNC